MDGSDDKAAAPARERRGWLKRITNKSMGEVATEATLLVIGAALMYAIDPILMSRAPVAFQYLIQFLAYVNQHAVSVVLY